VHNGLPAVGTALLQNCYCAIGIATAAATPAHLLVHADKRELPEASYSASRAFTPIVQNSPEGVRVAHYARQLLQRKAERCCCGHQFKLFYVCCAPASSTSSCTVSMNAFVRRGDGPLMQRLLRLSTRAWARSITGEPPRTDYDRYGTSSLLHMRSLLHNGQSVTNSRHLPHKCSRRAGPTTTTMVCAPLRATMHLTQQ
jgi:hypothetical protein